MLLYLKNPKNSTLKLLDTINSSNNVAGYKIKLQKSVVFLYTNNDQIEKEYRKANPFTTAPLQNIKCLGIKLTKYVNYPYKN
jgi:hypothetical protein